MQQIGRRAAKRGKAASL